MIDAFGNAFAHLKVELVKFGIIKFGRGVDGFKLVDVHLKSVLLVYLVVLSTRLCLLHHSKVF